MTGILTHYSSSNGVVAHQFDSSTKILILFSQSTRTWSSDSKQQTSFWISESNRA